MHFWNNLHQVHSKLKDLGAIKPKGLNMIAKFSYGNLCLREKNLSFINNYII
jgi:hypothetical protein